MRRVSVRKWTGKLILLGLTLVQVSCLGSRSTLEELGNVNGSTLPIVEAYLEYSGPSKTLSAPQSFLVHVVAKDTKTNQGNARVYVTPPDLAKSLPQVLAGRAPASQKQLSVERARSMLTHLSKVVQEGAKNEKQYRGCMYPVRVFLIDADGGITENRGCRGESGWEKQVSLLVSDLVLYSQI